MASVDPLDIIHAITSAPITVSAKEQAAELAEAWINEHAEFDAQFTILAAEIPWYLWLDGDTLLVGVMDCIAQDKVGIFSGEWKTCKAPQKNKDGNDSAWWNEEVWLESISTGTQLAVYGLGLSKGTFVLEDGKLWIPAVKVPRIMVRAAVKDSPPYFWPTKREDGIFQFPSTYLTKVYGALRSKAQQIRASRQLNIVPWALPGNHCTNRFRKLCPYHADYCLAGKHPHTPPKTIFDGSDPGAAAIKFGLRASKRPKDDTSLVIFSASSYDTAQQCVERYRILVGGFCAKEQDQALDVGTGLHIALAQFYKQQISKKGELYR